MATARRLPSGNWRVNQYIGLDENGKRRYKSFTAPSKKQAEYAAAAYILERDNIRMGNITLKQAVEEYLRIKSNILSPSTLRGYRFIAEKHFISLQGMKLNKITAQMVQDEVNKLALSLSPKTVRNVVTFFFSATKNYSKAFANVALPPVRKSEFVIPTDSEVMMLICAADGELKIAIALAALAGLRRGEVKALDWKNVNLQERILTIDSSLATDERGGKVLKAPKSQAGFRQVPICDVLFEILRDCPYRQGQVVKMFDSSITRSFQALCKNLGYREYRYHDLRHYFASTMLALNVPDKYAMQLMGHATNSTLKYVYQHTMKDKEKEIADNINQHFTNLYRGG